MPGVCHELGLVIQTSLPQNVKDSTTKNKCRRLYNDYAGRFTVSEVCSRRKASQMYIDERVGLLLLSCFRPRKTSAASQPCRRPSIHQTPRQVPKVHSAKGEGGSNMRRWMKCPFGGRTGNVGERLKKSQSAGQNLKGLINFVKPGLRLLS